MIRERLVLATRASALARAQAALVADALTAAHPGLEVSLKEVRTTGDRQGAAPITALTEVGAFVRAVQQAVLDGEADAAVHSCKDLPVAGPAELTAFYPAREAPWDVLCGGTPEGLPRGARVGTGSPRRAAQLQRLRPDLRVEDIRGNVDTRVAKVASGEYDAVVLAEAGLRRLGGEEAIDHRFTLEEMVPAPAQAALAVEVMAGSEAANLLLAVDDPATRLAVETERALLAATGAGCRAALGALAVADEPGAAIHVSGFVSDEQGPRRAQADGDHPEQAAARLAEALGL